MIAESRPGPDCLCSDPETVHEISTRGGTRFHARCTRSGCGCTTYRPATAGATTTFRLTDRQHQILTLAAWGNTNRQIGRELHCSERTVKADLNRAAQALGGRNTTHTVALAIAARLVTAPVLTVEALADALGVVVHAGGGDG